MTKAAWICATACVAVSAAAWSAYVALHGTPSCAASCHAAIPPAAWSRGGDFAPGGALYRIGGGQDAATDRAQVSVAVAEPSTWVLFGGGLLALTAIRARRA